MITKGILYLWLLILCGCTSVPSISPAQRRALQMRTFEKASYENVFGAFKKVLEDSGYQIKNQDMSGGLIEALFQKNKATTGSHPSLDKSFQVSVNLEKVNKVTVESRVSIQTTESGHEIFDEKIYQNIYDPVHVEIERHKAKNKS